ncbi:MAG: insulinase family protein [Gemmatimonadaceae bacterium]
MRAHVSLALLSVVAWSAQSSPLPAQATPARAAPAARVLANGLKVWVHPVANDATADVMLMVAGGASLDPLGKEELAHFAEHVAFGDRPGLTEQALNAEMESLGGRIVARTSFDCTMYRVTLPVTHVASAIAWMARIVTPRTVTPALVQQQLPPILLELGAARRSRSQRLVSLYRDPAWLRRASPWKRDFGFDTFDDRDYDAQRSLSHITSDDVQAFMERTYVPSNMTLVIAGGLDSAAAVAAQAAIDRAFSSLPARPAPARPRATAAGSPSSVTIWTPRGTATHAHILRGHGLRAEDRALVLFLRDLLDRRLNERLRYGNAKLVYHPGVTLAFLGDAAIVTAYAASEANNLDAVRAIIDEEVARLRAGAATDVALDSAFRADRDAIAQATSLALNDREAFVEAAHAYFFATAPDEAMPDVGAAQASVTPARLAQLLHERFPASRETTRTMRPLPLPTAFLLLMALAVVWVTTRMLRARLVVPVDLRTLRYVARLRVDAPIALALLLAGGSALAIGGRLAVAVVRPALEQFVFPLPAALQLATYPLALVVAVALAILALSRIPRKVLVFDDHLRLKYLAYRSIVIPASELAECRLAGFDEGWTLAACLRGWALTLGLRRNALLIRLRDGRTLFVRTRATIELQGAIDAVRASLSAPGP